MTTTRPHTNRDDVSDLDRLRGLYESIHDSTTNGAPSPVVVERADALIAALGDEIAELTGQNIDLEVWRASAVKRAEQAEADLAAMTKERDEEKDYIHQLEGWLAQVRERSASLLEERNALTEERDRARDQRCRDCEHWDREHAETVANVAFAYCDNKIATKEFKSSVMSEGWLCPLLARYQPAEEER